MKELKIVCPSARIDPNRAFDVTVTIEGPNIEELLTLIHKDDLATHIASEGYKPGALFDEEKLEKWAEENGYIKE